MGEWVGRYITMTLELLVVLMLALTAWTLVAAVLDGLFGWGVMDATRDFLDPVIPDGSGTVDPGDCDPHEQVC